MRPLKHSFRSLRRSPGFVLVALLTLTVGIGSSVAVFSIIDAVMLRQLPVKSPSELTRMGLAGKDGEIDEIPSNAIDVLKDNAAFRGLCGFNTSMLNVEVDGNMRSEGVSGFTGNCFATLGLEMQLGRPITPADDHLGTEPIAVITDSLWHSAFDARTDVLDKQVQIGHQLYTIVGVTREGFTGLLIGFPQPIMVPLLARPDVLPNGTKPTYYWVNLLARRAPGVSQSQAAASVEAQARQILERSVPRRYNASQRKDYIARKLVVASGARGVDYFLARRFGEPLYGLLVICFAVLLIGCLNVSSLVLARNLHRRREVAVRLALGGSMTHVGALFVLENAMLTVAGAALGTMSGIAAARVMLARGDQIFGNFKLNVALDGRLLLFVGAAILLALCIFAATSVWQAVRLSHSDALKEGGRGFIPANSAAQKLLLATQIALTLAFVTGSALFAASLKNMYSIDLGIEPRNVWEALLTERPNNIDAAPHYRTLLAQIESLPDIESASFSDAIPFFTFADQEAVGTVENPRLAGGVQAREIAATDAYFKTLGIKLREGEDFRRDDTNSREPTAIVSWSLAQRLAPSNGDPRALIGSHLRLGNEAEYQRLRVIGIASDADLNLANLDDQKPFTVYINFWQHRDAEGYPVLLVKTRGEALPITSIRSIVRQTGSEYVGRVTSLGSEIDNALVENRFIAYISGVFAVLALGMAAVGLFGLLTYQVASRTSEIGVRIALGAGRRHIRSLVMEQIGGLLVYGTAAGIVLTLAVGKLLAHFLFRISAYDARPFLIAGATLAVTALIAAWIPMRRASSIHPSDALRHE